MTPLSRLIATVGIALALLGLRRDAQGAAPTRGDLAPPMGALPQAFAESQARQFLEKGLAHRAANQLPAAVESFTAGLTLSPSSSDLHVELGMTQAWMGDHDQALASFDRALSLDAKHTGANYGRARVLVWAGRHDEAEAAYTRLLQQYPQELEPLRGMALVHRDRLELDRARELYQRVLRTQPDDVESIEGLAAINRQSRWLVEAGLGATSIGATTTLLGGGVSATYQWSQASSPYARYEALVATGLGSSVGTTDDKVIHLAQLGAIHRLNEAWTLDASYQLRLQSEAQVHLLGLRASRRLFDNWVALAGLRPGVSPSGSKEFLVDVGLQRLLSDSAWLMLQAFGFRDSNDTSTESIVATGSWSPWSSAILKAGSALGRVNGLNAVSGFASAAWSVTTNRKLVISYEEMLVGTERRSLRATWIANL